MAKNLVIVESPAKVKTIKKFLGSSFEVMASNGHVRDLPKSQLGFSPENDYEPKYITIRGKGDLLAALRKEAKKAEKIYLATDPDREGEAIAWHLFYALKLEGKKVYRITFNEITKNAVKESIKNPREIHLNLVDAQQTRRMLDRMVGYRISPLLWAKIKRGLSAGRVQSVALRIICDREKEIDAFIPEEYWSLETKVLMGKQKKAVSAKYYGESGEKRTPSSKAEIDRILKEIEGCTYQIVDIKKGERTKHSALPFTTSTLQQEASNVLNFTTQKTMRLAQQLYEGVDVKGEGTVGLITYLRTDSTRVSEEAQLSAREYIQREYGPEYAIQSEKEDKSNKKIQDAHEAIRPTSLERSPIALKDQLPRDLLKLYQLIYRRFLASQMAPAKYETTNIKIAAGKHLFTVAGSKCVFEGFSSVYSVDQDKDEDIYAGTITMDTPVTHVSSEAKQHFTQPPAHYTESSLVKALEELGIGRPSTYAPTISTIIRRAYVTKKSKNLIVTDLGSVVNQMMEEAFPSIVDVHFTANLEALLDGIEAGNVNWKTVIANFYPDLDEAVKQAEKELAEIVIPDEESNEICENCGRHMVIKIGPHGKFYACPGYPECKSTKTYFEKTGIMCPKCGKDIVIKTSKKGRNYYSCIDSPECNYMLWQRPTGILCPKCNNMLVEKGKKYVCSNAECDYQQIKS